MAQKLNTFILVTISLFITITLNAGCLLGKKSEPKAQEEDPKTPPAGSPFSAQYVSYTIMQNGSHEHENFTSAMSTEGATTLLAPTNVQTVWQVKFAATDGSPIKTTINSMANNNVLCTVNESTQVFRCENLFTASGSDQLSFVVHSTTHCLKNQPQGSQSICMNPSTIPANSKTTVTIPYRSVDVQVAIDKSLDCLLFDFADNVNDAKNKDRILRPTVDIIANVLKADNNCRKD
ncbi:MAG: hypothetical protein OXC40_07795 [Proteobacteria bacterium]|nr:hypothetical protein [Pseudomonadota bacterium]